MGITERARSRFPAGTAGVTPLAGARELSHRATATAKTTTLVLAISIVAVAVRLLFINQTYVDRWSWRQSDVAAIARNFNGNGFHFAHPQIDWAGPTAGYVGTEFPILPFIAAACYNFLGVHEWIGRIQAVIFFAVSLPFFFLLVRETFDNTAAVWATLFFSMAPLNIFAGRSFIPDVPSLSLAIIGSYFFLQWVRKGSSVPFCLASIAISLSLLIKITSIVIAAPLLYLAVAGGVDPASGGTRVACGCRGQRPRLQLALFVAITLLPSLAWYWHAHQIAEKFYPHHFFGAGGIRIENLAWYFDVARKTATSRLTPVLSILALIGLIVAPRLQRSERGTSPPVYPWFFHWWLAAMVLFIVVVGYGNRHPWYQLPLAPIAAALAGAACAFIGTTFVTRRFAQVMLSLMLVLLFAILSYVYTRPFYEASAAQLRDAGLVLKKITPANALIVAADTGDPTIFYYAERKGWHFLEEDAVYGGNPSDSEEAIADLEQLRARGATHFVLTTNTFWWLDYYPEFTQHLTQSATLLEATTEFRIYRLATGIR